MAIISGQFIVRGKEKVEETPQPAPSPSAKKIIKSSSLHVNNLVIKNKNVEETGVTDIKSIKKKKVNILTKRNRTQIFNFDKSSPYLEDLLTSED